jgi:hypothetical protein
MVLRVLIVLLSAHLASTNMFSHQSIRFPRSAEALPSVEMNMATIVLPSVSWTLGHLNITSSPLVPFPLITAEHDCPYITLTASDGEPAQPVTVQLRRKVIDADLLGRTPVAHVLQNGTEWIQTTGVSSSTGQQLSVELAPAMFQQSVQLSCFLMRYDEILQRSIVFPNFETSFTVKSAVLRIPSLTFKNVPATMEITVQDYDEVNTPQPKEVGVIAAACKQITIAVDVTPLGDFVVWLDKMTTEMSEGKEVRAMVFDQDRVWQRIDGNVINSGNTMDATLTPKLFLNRTGTSTVILSCFVVTPEPGPEPETTPPPPAPGIPAGQVVGIVLGVFFALGLIFYYCV